MVFNVIPRHRPEEPRCRNIVDRLELRERLLRQYTEVGGFVARGAGTGLGNDKAVSI